MPERTREEYADMPFGGLFGDTNQIRIIQQVVADPFGDYKPKELEALVEASSPSVRKALKNLTQIGLLIKNTKDRQHPVYRVNVDSPIYLALNFLAFAVPDHINHTDFMQDVIADYYDLELREKYEPNNYLIINSSVGLASTAPASQKLSNEVTVPQMKISSEEPSNQFKFSGFSVLIQERSFSSLA